MAVKGLGGFLLACDAQNDVSVNLLRARKRRSDKPFALMARDLAAVESFCIVSDTERAVLLSARRPIVVLRRRPDAAISSAVAPGNNTIGVMLPYTPLHYLLFSDSPDDPAQFRALVMTSGNISEEPIVTSNEEAWERLQPVADWFVFHNRDIYMRTDDSVVRTFAGRERVLRRSRGYVPHPVDLGVPLQRDAGLRRRTEKYFLSDQGYLRNPESTYRRSGELRDARLLRGNTGEPEEAIPGRASGGGLRSASQLYELAFRAEIAAGAQNRSSASSCAHCQLHGGKPSSAAR